jgi:hypothetical protein
MECSAFLHYCRSIGWRRSSGRKQGRAREPSGAPASNSFCFAALVHDNVPDDSLWRRRLEHQSDVSRKTPADDCEGRERLSGDVCTERPVYRTEGKRCLLRGAEVMKGKLTTGGKTNKALLTGCEADGRQTPAHMLSPLRMGRLDRRQGFLCHCAFFSAKRWALQFARVEGLLVSTSPKVPPQYALNHRSPYP